MSSIIDNRIRLDLELAPYETVTVEGIVDTYLTSVRWEATERGVLVPLESDEEIIIYPEFGAGRFYRNIDLGAGLVTHFMNRKWLVRFNPVYEGPIDELLPAGGTIEFTALEGDVAETPWKDEEEVYDKELHWPKLDEYTARLFGQPDFKQQDLSLSMTGATHALPVFLVFYDSWGDMGNWNIFVDVDLEGNPLRAYYESACG